ncbi:MAG: hypothetical protein ACREV6_10370 [Clostridium sp.]|uniref:hypothetical protein n=1 Tax=Clostridium sp. TaxID=1506 RepID=UPI003D6D0F0C
MKSKVWNVFLWKEFLNYKKIIINMCIFLAISYFFIFNNKDIITNIHLICCNIVIFSMMASMIDTFMNNIDMNNMEIYLATSLSLEEIIFSKAICIFIKMVIQFVLLIVGILIIVPLGLNFNIISFVTFIFLLISLKYFIILLGTIATIYLKKCKSLIIVLQMLMFIIVNITYIVDHTLKFQLSIIIMVGLISHLLTKKILQNCVYENIVERSIKR